MSSEENSETLSFWRKDNPILWGIALTAAFLTLCAWLATRQHCENGTCLSEFQTFLTLPPNTMGDTLGGIASVLAFLWIIVTVWLQSQELAAQREELKLTRHEIEEQKEATQAMAKAQAEQVRLLEVQGKIFIDEQRQRSEDRAERLLEQLLENLDFLATNERDLAETWTSSVAGGRPQRHFLFYADPSKTPEQRIAKISAAAESGADRIIQMVSTFGQTAKSGQKEYFIKIELLLSEIESIKASLAEHQLARLRKLNIASLSTAIGRLLAADIWSEPEEESEA